MVMQRREQESVGSIPTCFNLLIIYLIYRDGGIGRRREKEFHFNLTLTKIVGSNPTLDTNKANPWDDLFTTEEFESLFNVVAVGLFGVRIPLKTFNSL